MEHTGRPVPPRRRHLTGLLLLLVAVATVGGAGALLRISFGVKRNLEAMVVTPAPIVVGDSTPAPLLALPTLAPASVDAPRPATVLLLGTDRRPGEEVVPRSDAILVVRVDPTSRRVAVLSLPRDLWVAIPGHGRNRLNSAFLWGERDGPPGAGMAMARAAVGDLLGLPIDYVATTDFRGFAALVDAIGGITINVERPLRDDRFPTLDRRTTTVRFSPGPQPMDGATALTYARIRHPDSDFERGARQQAVLVAIAQALRNRGYLANLLAAERLTGALAGYVQTDMPPERMLELAWALRELDAAAVERYALREAEVVFGVDNDRFAQTPRPGVIERYARLLLYGTK
ncbi:MAG: LCP family protein, partial [Chloroflexales bacterium]|nr:LCP family protein [Chloroflexales bacterium]